MEKIPVIIRKYVDGSGVVAIFPTVPSCPGNATGSWWYSTSYMHIGQHSACLSGVLVSKTIPAFPDEVADMLKELQSIGYKNLVVKKKNHHSYYTKLMENAKKFEPTPESR